VLKKFEQLKICFKLILKRLEAKAIALAPPKKIEARKGITYRD